MFKKIIIYLLRGVLYVVPLSLTIYSIYLAFRFIDNILSPFIENFLNINIPGLGFLLIILILIMLGFLGSTFIFKWFYGIVDKLLNKIPIIKLLYSSLKDLFSAFVGNKKKFTEPVLVKINNDSDIEKIGFITNKELDFIGDNSKKIAVYLPFSFAFMGDLFIIPASKVKRIDMSAAEAMKFVIAGGVINLED